MFYSDNSRYEMIEVEDLQNFKDIDLVSLFTLCSDLSPCARKTFNLVLLMTIYEYYANLISYDVFHAYTGGNRKMFYSVIRELNDLFFWEYNFKKDDVEEKVFAEIKLIQGRSMYIFSLSAELIRQLEFKICSEKIALCYNFIGTNVRYFRYRHGWTRENLAVKVGVSNKHIQYIERGERKPSYKTLVSLCRVLNCNPDDLMCTLHLRFGKNLMFP